MIHTNYQPGRKGLFDSKILAEKLSRSQPHGPTALPFNEYCLLKIVQKQHQRLRYSDQGDFTRCYRGGFY